MKRDMEEALRKFRAEVALQPAGGGIWQYFKDNFVDTNLLSEAELEWWDDQGHGRGPVIGHKCEIYPDNSDVSRIFLQWCARQSKDEPKMKMSTRDIDAAFYVDDYQFQDRGDDKIWCVHRFKENDEFVFHTDGDLLDISKL